MEYIGIGKIILESLNTKDYNIPHLHFIFVKENNYISAINLEFGLVATNENYEVAVNDLIIMLIEFLKRNIEAYSFSIFQNLVATDSMESYWIEYRRLDFILAEQKKDLGNSLVQTLKKTILNQFVKNYGLKPVTKFSLIRDVA